MWGSGLALGFGVLGFGQGAPFEGHDEQHGPRDVEDAGASFRV